MEKSAHYFTVGIFVTLTILAIIGFLIWLASPQDEEDYNFYTVEFHDTISGLEEGSDVQYQGVMVGKVLNTHLVPEDNTLVRVDIGVDKKTPVRAHTKVTLQPQGITALVKLEMTTAENDMLMPEQREGMPHPVLQGQGSQLYKVMEDLPVISAQVADITKELKDIIHRNRGSFDRFASQGLPQFSEAAHEMKNMAASARKLSDNLNENPSQLLYQPSSQGVEIP